MHIDVEYELSKINFESCLDNTPNEKRIRALIQYCNAVEFLCDEPDKYKDIKQIIFNKYLFYSDRNDSNIKNFSDFNSNNFRLSLKTINEYEHVVSLESDSQKLSKYYRLSIFVTDFNVSLNDLTEVCLKKFIKDFDVDISIFNNEIMEVQQSCHGHAFRNVTASDIKKIFHIYAI